MYKTPDDFVAILYVVHTPVIYRKCPFESLTDGR